MSVHPRNPIHAAALVVALAALAGCGEPASAAVRTPEAPADAGVFASSEDDLGVAVSALTVSGTVRTGGSATSSTVVGSAYCVNVFRPRTEVTSARVEVEILVSSPYHVFGPVVLGPGLTRTFRVTRTTRQPSQFRITNLGTGTVAWRVYAC